MQDRWRSIAIAAAGAAFGARAAYEPPLPANGGGASPAVRTRAFARERSDAVRFGGARTQRQVSTYLLYRSFSTDERNTRRFEWWREAQGRRDTEPATQQES